jgi:hypothetical protein
MYRMMLFPEYGGDTPLLFREVNLGAGAPYPDPRAWKTSNPGPSLNQCAGAGGTSGRFSHASPILRRICDTLSPPGAS